MALRKISFESKLLVVKSLIISTMPYSIKLYDFNQFRQAPMDRIINRAINMIVIRGNLCILQGCKILFIKFSSEEILIARVRFFSKLRSLMTTIGDHIHATECIPSYSW